MRGWIIVLALVLVLAVSANAQKLNESLCSDTDGGGIHKSDAALKVKGEVKYGITTQADTCLTNENGVSSNSSNWLKEYFCRDDKREATVYNCVTLGYTGCKDGECYGSTSGSTSNQSSVPVVQSSCGNKKLEKDKGEECDPPDHICFGKTTEQYGLCDSNCKCKIAGAAKKPEPQCGDGARDVGEECEKDDECPKDYLCSSCKCVKQLTPEEIEAMKAGKSANVSAKINEEYKNPETHEVDLSTKNFTEELPGMKATSGIAGFFKSIFSWIASLFG